MSATAASLIVSHRYQDGEIMDGFGTITSAGTAPLSKEDNPKITRTNFIVMKEGADRFPRNAREIGSQPDRLR